MLKMWSRFINFQKDSAKPLSHNEKVGNHNDSEK